MQYELIRFSLFCIFSLPIVISDIRTMKIPVLFSYAGMGFMLIYLILIDESMVKILSSVIFPFLLFITVKFICPGGLGNGDIHYGFFCGLFGGIAGINAGLFLAATFAAIFMLTKKIKKLPFCPFMFFGMIFGRVVVLLYLSMTCHDLSGSSCFFC